MRRLTIAVALALCGLAAAASAAGGRVLLVGTFHGIHGQYRSLQAAVNAAKSGDVILVGPGDYKTKHWRHPHGRSDLPAAVLVTTPNITIRGMNRNTVIIDGTSRGRACNRKAANQSFGPKSSKGRLGLNGIMIYKARNVSVENLTACNFLGGFGDTGNEIWWNGGDGSAMIGGWGYYGAYLNATSTFYDATSKTAELTAAKYGIFSSDWSGGTWFQDYASNFNDSGFYVGACQQACDQTLNHVWSQFSSLGYSGSNSGGKMVIENSEFDHNKDGFDTNSQNGDNPPPQDGSCPHGGTSPITHTQSCWVFMHNFVHDNNNPNVPAQGLSAEGPVGTGMSVSGGRNDTIMDNTFQNNNAWGIIFVPFLDSGPPCTGGTMNALGQQGSCLYDEWGDALLNNTFINNGGYGHPSNGDFGFINLENGHPTSCFNGNHEANGQPVKPADAALWQTTHPSCNGTPATAGSNDPQFLTEVLCNAQVSITSGPPSCPNGQYPRFKKADLMPLPTHKLHGMKNPCAGVANNPWCRHGKPVSHA